MGGIAIPQVASTAMLGAGEIIVYAYSKSLQAKQAAGNQALLGTVAGLDTQFRPPQWSAPALTMLTVPANYITNTQQVSSQIVDNAGNQVAAPVVRTSPAAQPQYLVFDGVMRLSHSQKLRMTSHPIQDGANVTDHAYLDPAHLIMDVKMTDVLPDFSPNGTPCWVGNQSKSISCFQTLSNLRAARVPLTVTTRLMTYTNMFIIDVQPLDTVKTRYGLEATVEFQQIFLFSVASQAVSARQQTTDTTTLGQTNPTPVPAGVTAQQGMPSSSTGAPSPAAIQQSTGKVIGASVPSAAATPAVNNGIAGPESSWGWQNVMGNLKDGWNSLWSKGDQSIWHIN
jgi:hypothetical protein